MRKYTALILLIVPIAVLAQSRSPVVPKLLSTEDLSIEVQPEELQRQYGALQGMQLNRLEYSKRGPVRHISGNTGVVLPSRAVNAIAGQRDSDILMLFKDVLLASGTESLVVTRNDEKSNIRTLRMKQQIRGIPVIQSFVGVNFDKSTGRVTELAAFFIPDRSLAHDPKLSAVEAEQLVPQFVQLAGPDETNEVEVLGDTYLAYFADSSESTPANLVWVVQVQLKDGEQWAYYVNAISGLLVAQLPATQALTRRVYNANNGTPNVPSGLPSQMTLAQIATDQLANSAYTKIATADSRLRQRFQLPSGNFPSSTRQVIRYGYTVPQVIHKLIGTEDYITYSKPLPIAPSTTQLLDITAHEYAHGVALRTFSLGTNTFNYEGGALHESFGDIAAATVQIAEAGSPSSATWRIAEGWRTDSTKALRSMSNPAGDSYETGMEWYPFRGWGLTSTWMNSTILSHAYYLSINGGLNAGALLPWIPEIVVPPLDFSTSGAETRARQIFIAAFDSIAVDANPTFMEMKLSAINAASTLYGPAAMDSIAKAFEAVGVGYQCSSQPAIPDPILDDLQCNGRFAINWPDVAGADRYIVIIAPQVYGWAYGDVTTDGDINHCMVQVASMSMMRMTACNSCGCSSWSDTQYLPFWPGQCP